MQQSRNKLLQKTKEGVLWSAEKDNAVRCYACGHRCPIPLGRDGVCKIRSNVGGKLYVPWGYVAGLAVDPIEKKPFFHAYPGSKTLSFGMLGCDLHCDYCQNWFTSQVLRDPRALASSQDISIEEITGIALESGSKVLTSTYNEPLITAEWAVEIFKASKARGLVNAFVSNGNATAEVLRYLRPWLSLIKIDLKTFNDKRYRKLGAVLQNVLDSIEMCFRMGFWLELVTLLIPGFNDSESELKEMAGFVASISPEIPWHVTAFQKDYKLLDKEAVSERTSIDRLFAAAQIGKEAGLHYVYLGNAPGLVGDWENTYCPECQSLLIDRKGFHIRSNYIVHSHCPSCMKKIPGVWAF